MIQHIYGLISCTPFIKKIYILLIILYDCKIIKKAVTGALAQMPRNNLTV